MIIPDTNLLIYAHDESCPQHRKALEWWQRTLGGSETVGIPWIVLLAFTRLLTSPQICLDPLTVGQVREMGGNFCTDALIALHAREHSAVVYSNDRDFDRFPGLKWVNPLR
jgi:predicted nucleic acid-binding protein